MTDAREPRGDARPALVQLFSVDPRDAGCEETMALLDVYIDTVVAGHDPELTMPGITAHLRSCLPCRMDFDGLLAAVTATNDR
jgi:hypothetical protein